MNFAKNKVALVIAGGFALATYLFAWSPIFEVSQIKVIGTPGYSTDAAIITASEIRIGDKLARIEPRSIDRRLHELNWIKRAELSRNWINGNISIHIWPRIPVGIYNGRALDSSGKLFDYPGITPAHLPQVSASTPELGLRAIALFKEMPLDLRENLIAISVPNDSSISSRHREGGSELSVQWGSLQEIALKVKVYKALLALPENKNVKSIDLSAPHAPIVQ